MNNRSVEVNAGLTMANRAYYGVTEPYEIKDNIQEYTAPQNTN